MFTFTAKDLTFSAIFIVLMTIGANITFWLPFLAIPIGGVNVPLSLQPFFAILSGLLLGRRLGVLSMTGYLALGIIGVPVFSQLQAGPFVLFNYTGGFLLSFVLISFLSGFLKEKLRVTNLKSLTTITMTSTIVSYLIGVSYMYLAMNVWLNLNVSYVAAWISMIPFLIKDLVLALLLASIALRLLTQLPHLKNGRR